MQRIIDTEATREVVAGPHRVVIGHMPYAKYQALMLRYFAALPAADRDKIFAAADAPGAESVNVTFADSRYDGLEAIVDARLAVIRAGVRSVAGVSDLPAWLDRLSIEHVASIADAIMAFNGLERDEKNASGSQSSSGGSSSECEPTATKSSSSNTTAATARGQAAETESGAVIREVPAPAWSTASVG